MVRVKYHPISDWWIRASSMGRGNLEAKIGARLAEGWPKVIDKHGVCSDLSFFILFAFMKEFKRVDER